MGEFNLVLGWWEIFFSEILKLELLVNNPFKLIFSKLNQASNYSPLTTLLSALRQESLIAGELSANEKFENH